MKNNPPATISPAAIASKLAALKNLQSPKFSAAVASEPRLVEVLHWWQWRSIQPGGIAKGVEEFLTLFADRLGSDVMHRIGKTDQPYTASERQDVIASFPSYMGEKDFQGNYRSQEPEWDRVLSRFDGEMHGRSSFINNHVARPDLAFVNKQNHSYFADYCRQVAQLHLPRAIAEFCSESDSAVEAPFYFPDLPAALVEMLDAHAGMEADAIALTEVKVQITDALDFAVQERAMVEIVGDSRWGKTVAIQNYCTAHPGKCRLVKTPCDSSERSFLDAIADAIGFNFPFDTPLREVTANVKHVLKNSGLMFIFDEAAWLIPTRYTKRTTPVRLNFVRSYMLDQACPVALVVTPQFSDRSANKFETATGFNLAQFKGRIMRRVELQTPPESDLRAVVQNQFPELPGELQPLVVGAAMATTSYLFGVEKITKNTRAIVKKKGAERVTRADVETGIAYAGIRVASEKSQDLSRPSPRLKSEISNVKSPQPDTAAPRSRSTRPATALEAPARVVTPLTPQPA